MQMKKFRNWLFKLLTGYDLLDYEEILKFAASVNKSGDETLKLAIDIHNDNKEILEHNRKVLEANQRVLDISHKTIEDCRSVLALCREANENETLD
jgi:hypothetical protein